MEKLRAVGMRNKVATMEEVRRHGLVSFASPPLGEAIATACHRGAPDEQNSGMIVYLQW